MAGLDELEVRFSQLHKEEFRYLAEVYRDREADSNNYDTRGV